MKELSASKMQELEELAMPDLQVQKNGQVILRPPQNLGQGRESLFRQFKNTNPNSKYNFWFSLTIVKQGAIFMCTKLVPLADGGLAIFTAHNHYMTILATNYIKTLESEHSNFGVINLAKLKVDEYYAESQKTIYELTFKIRFLDANNQLVEEKEVGKKEAAKYQFPPLSDSGSNPGEAVQQNSLNQLELNSFNVNGRILFPKFKKISAKNYGLEEGYSQDTNRGELSWIIPQRSTPPPNMLIYECTEQPGALASALELWMLTDNNGVPKPFFGHFSTSFKYKSIYTEILKKIERSSFKKKTTITTLRQEFMVEGVKYNELFAP